TAARSASGISSSAPSSWRLRRSSFGRTGIRATRSSPGTANDDRTAALPIVVGTGATKPRASRKGSAPGSLYPAFLRQPRHPRSIAARGKGLVEVTPQVKQWVGEQGITTGLLTLYCRHTSASLLIQENADPDVRTDLETFFEDVAPETRDYVHATEGAD